MCLVQQSRAQIIEVENHGQVLRCVEGEVSIADSSTPATCVPFAGAFAWQAFNATDHMWTGAVLANLHCQPGGPHSRNREAGTDAGCRSIAPLLGCFGDVVMRLFVECPVPKSTGTPV